MVEVERPVVVVVPAVRVGSASFFDLDDGDGNVEAESGGGFFGSVDEMMSGASLVKNEEIGSGDFGGLVGSSSSSFVGEIDNELVGGDAAAVGPISLFPCSAGSLLSPWDMIRKVQP